MSLLVKILLSLVLIGWGIFITAILTAPEDEGTRHPHWGDEE